MNRIEIGEQKKPLKSKYITIFFQKICSLLIPCAFLSIIFGNELIFDTRSILWTFSTITVSSVTLFGILAAFTIFRLQSDQQEIGIRQNRLEVLIKETEKSGSPSDFCEKNSLEFFLAKRSNNTPEIKRAVFHYASDRKFDLAYECIFHLLEVQKLKRRAEDIRLRFFPRIIQLVILIFISIILTPLVNMDTKGVLTEVLKSVHFYWITSFCVFFIIGFAFLTLFDITRILVNFATFYEAKTMEMLFNITNEDNNDFSYPKTKS